MIQDLLRALDSAMFTEADIIRIDASMLQMQLMDVSLFRDYARARSGVCRCFPVALVR